MSTEKPISTPERRNAVSDNARKFVLEPLGQSFFADTPRTTFTLAIDWISTEEASEEKLAHKTFVDGTVEILHIAKVTDTDGKRTTVKNPISLDEYETLRASSTKHLEKVRTDFTYTQGDVSYPAKYDVFTGTSLVLLEVEDEDKEPFQPVNFPTNLKEVSGDAAYSGYRICETLGQYR